ncbi:MAG: YesL family protein [Coprococcus sp.]
MAYIINIIYVSVLWILFSIPIITIGASSTALYYTVTKVIRHGRSYIFREFWQSFKSNLKQSTAVWLIYLVMMGILLVDIRVMGAFGTAVSQTLQFVFIVGICMVSAVMVYALAYIARFTQDAQAYFDKQCADGHPALAENTAAGCCSGGGSAGLLPVWAWDCLYPCCGSPGG